MSNSIQYSVERAPLQLIAIVPLREAVAVAKTRPAESTTRRLAVNPAPLRMYSKRSVGEMNGQRKQYGIGHLGCHRGSGYLIWKSFCNFEMMHGRPTGLTAHSPQRESNLAPSAVVHVTQKGRPASRIMQVSSDR